MFFKKGLSEVEIINDINQNLINLYRVLKQHPQEFLRQLEWKLVSRSEFDCLRKLSEDHLTDIQKAARWFYLLKLMYGGKFTSFHYSGSALKKPKLNLRNIPKILKDVHQRLLHVNIENLQYEHCIHRYDRSTTFFYLDPPYFGCEEYYGKGIFSREDFTHLAKLLTDLKGKFIMSINDTSEIRDLFKMFSIREVKTRYQAAGGDRRKEVTELLIMNFKPL